MMNESSGISKLKLYNFAYLEAVDVSEALEHNVPAADPEDFFFQIYGKAKSTLLRNKRARQCTGGGEGWEILHKKRT